jgi:3-dehydroquinate dehydratase-2
MAKHILMINGPNLNLLGLREPHLYGSTTLSQLQSSLEAHCASLSPPVHLTSFQSNHEGAILDKIHSCHPTYRHKNPTSSSITSYTSTSSTSTSSTNLQSLTPEGPQVDAIVINAGGLTHTSVVLRDALVGVGIPFVEVHVTNVHAREGFRHLSFLSEKAVAVICGLGTYGYQAAVDFCVGHLKIKS